MALTRRIASFGVKTVGRVTEGYYIIDCRRLRNPFKLPMLHSLDGRALEVQDFVRQDSQFEATMDRALHEHTAGHDIAFGCHGGKHRSVAMAEMLAAKLRAVGVVVQVEHTALD